MPIRPFELPDDFSTLVDLIPRTFQYPENEAWSVQADEIEMMVDAFEGARRFWPLIRLLQRLSPPMRDMLLGYIWEEDGQSVGMSNVIREGATDRWLIGNVSVLPAYRRRGIARALVEACIRLARDKGAQAITLSVVDGNVPAYSLYERLGFERFSSHAEMNYERDTPPDDLPLPEGYTIERTSYFAWRPKVELAQRITPEAVRRYTPVEEGRYRRPGFLRLLAPIFERAMGMRSRAFVVRGQGQVVATAEISVRKRAGGINMMSVMFDPAHGALASFLVRYLLREILRLSPGRRIEFTAQHWQKPLIEAATEAGFVLRANHHTLGLLIDRRAESL